MSRDIAAWLKRDVGAPPAAIRQLYNGVDTGRFTPDGARALDCPWMEETGLVIGTVGRLDPVKNQQSLLRAFYRILERHPELHGRLRLIIAGDGPERAGLIDLARELGLLESVWMPGARGDIPDLMRAMDLFVLPSVNEGISNTILEAMATGRPVVAGNVGGNPELVEDGRTGVLYRADSDEDLADSILRYAKDPAMRSEHGEAARARVLERFSLDAMVRAYEEFYEELLNRDGSGARAAASENQTSTPGTAETAE